MSLFEVRAVYERTLENGKTAKVKEDYLVEAVTVTAAESRAIELLAGDIAGEFEIVSAKKRKVAELFEEKDGCKWYQAKVAFITLDEKTGDEKKTNSTMLVKSSNINGALVTLDMGMRGTMSDWECAGIAETTIVDVYLEEDSKTQADK